ncbi:ISAzo13 family transposase [Facilibium subflavum]|uniref:ISAzo13 family transposase n=2 Tax=Facilibium subflavum TaxID=2219058 RepID=UPI001F2637FC|nr:ISAzo13 family transposase [Facilibium subflavum]
MADDDLNLAFGLIMEAHTAGDPMDESVKWTNLTKGEIVLKLGNIGFFVSRTLVSKLLKLHGYKRRKMLHNKTIKQVADRDDQFQHIKALCEEFRACTDPMISIDTKKKEPLGDLHRDGYAFCNRPQDSYDHDYSYLAVGKAVPHGIYDMKQNKASIHLGDSHETAEFIADSLKLWWNHSGKVDYQSAKRLLILCDAGGANSYRSHGFKHALQNVANEIQLEIVIAHYPSYASKYNPIEHRVFPHVTRAINGAKLTTMQRVKSLMERAKTKTGLSVTAKIINKAYKTGKRYTKESLSALNLNFSKVLPKWNYSLKPMSVF